MATWISKDADNTVDLHIDWSEQLGSDDIASSAWTVATGLTNVSTAIHGKTATIFVSGGTSGATYSVENTIVTDAGRTLTRVLYVVVNDDDLSGVKFTTADVVRLAHRKIGVVSAEQSVSADQDAYAQDVLAALHGELDLDFSYKTPSPRYVWPLSILLAVELADHYQLAPPMPRSRAVMRLRAAVLSDDRKDDRDLDGDGGVTDAEIATAERAVYY